MPPVTHSMSTTRLAPHSSPSSTYTNSASTLVFDNGSTNGVLFSASGGVSRSFLIQCLFIAMVLIGCFSPFYLGALNWTTNASIKYAPLAFQTNTSSGFYKQSPDITKIDFNNQLPDALVAKNRLLEIGSGVAMGDVDGDGFVDIYFTSLLGGNKLYRNLGNWKFEEISGRAGVQCVGQYSTGCALADLDGDGDKDLLVNSLGGGTRFFVNDGKGTFTERTDTRLSKQGGATSMALGDVDGDGDLDLYVTCYRTDTFHDHPPGLKLESRRNPDGTTTIEPQDRFTSLITLNGGIEALEKGEPDQLYINRGSGNFSPVRWDVGVFMDEHEKPITGPTTDWGLAVLFRDINGDGAPDLYVCNDFVFWPDRIWLNQSGQRFKAASSKAFRSTSLSSMSADMADINRDGHDDLFVADMLTPHRSPRAWRRPDTLSGSIVWPVWDPEFRPEVVHNTLHLARGDGTFSEIAKFAGLAASDWTWSSCFLDVDLDGWEDLLLTTGNNHDVQDMDALRDISQNGGWRTEALRLQNLSRLPRRNSASMAFRNKQDLTFESHGKQWGFDATGVGHGMAAGDLDNDGDLDVVVNAMNEVARIYRNDCPEPRIAIRLRGEAGNTDGVNAKIRVTGGPVIQTQEMILGGRYCSSDDPMRVFAVGKAQRLSLEITWRDGTKTFARNLIPNHVYELSQTATSPAPVQLNVGRGLFKDISQSLDFSHVKPRYNDMTRNPLLPRKLSSLGPGLSLADVNQDGHADVTVGGAKSDSTVVFLGNGKAGFEKLQSPATRRVLDQDATSVLILIDTNRHTRLMEGLLSWEETGNIGSGVRTTLLHPQLTQTPESVMWKTTGSTGPIAMADVEGDGQLELFVGCRVIPGAYPRATSSYLFRHMDGQWKPIQEFPNVGMVSGAVFGDLDSDSDADLILATEWGPIRVFTNQNGKFIEVTSEKGFANRKGFWNGVTLGDFDGDGLLDIAASNWGMNWRMDQFEKTNQIVYLYYGEAAFPHTLLASTDPHLNKITPWREMKVLEPLIAGLRDKAGNSHGFSKLSVEQLFGDDVLPEIKRIEADIFVNAVFLNRGDQFVFKPLPAQAQFSVGFGIVSSDFDGDGREDLFLAQNFFGTDPESPRQDAGYGLVLRGNGQGDFVALKPKDSGISLIGEQRAAATADFDEDGRPDLAVTQHNGRLMLFQNQLGKPGLRVRLRGTDQHPNVVGAMVRVLAGGKPGLIRELRTGSGYWSQDSEILILPRQGSPEKISVRWPNQGADFKEYPWPMDASEVEISQNGITRIH